MEKDLVEMRRKELITPGRELLLRAGEIVRQVKILSAKEIGERGLEGVCRIEAEDCETSDKLSLVAKSCLIVSGYRREEAATRPLSVVYFETYQRLKSSGMPVVEDVFLIEVSEGKYHPSVVMMTDLESEGAFVYGREDWMGLILSRRGYLERDELLLSIEVEDMRGRAYDLVEKAQRNKIALAEDDPFVLVVDERGSWDVILLDIGGTEFDLDEDSLRRNNQRAFENFMEYITQTMQALKDRRPK